tara:strand:+ start:232 stop:411 length:180 start_codon:yes stop_codon:yes gene_type:complete
MGKKNRERGVPSQALHLDLYNKAKQQSHTGAKPLVPHINNPNVMVTQKVRRAQEARKKS